MYKDVLTKAEIFEVLEKVGEDIDAKKLNADEVYLRIVWALNHYPQTPLLGEDELKAVRAYRVAGFSNRAIGRIMGRSSSTIDKLV